MYERFTLELENCQSLYINFNHIRMVCFSRSKDMNSRIFKTDNGFFYENDGFSILLDETSYHGYQHRSPEHAQKDFIGVEDPRDNLIFSHWRFDQPAESFNQMMILVHRIGAYVLRDTPLDYVETAFNLAHCMNDDDFNRLLDGEDS